MYPEHPLIPGSPVYNQMVDAGRVGKYNNADYRPAAPVKPHLGCEKWLGDTPCGEPACVILGVPTSGDWRLCDHHAADIRLRFPEYVLRRHACSVCNREERWRSRLDAQGRCLECRP